MVKRGKTVSLASFESMWLNPNMRVQDMASVLGISESAVSQRAKSRGLAPRRNVHRGGKLNSALFREMWDANVSSKEMARHFLVGEPYLHRRARELKFPKRNINRWNSVPVLAFLSARLAKLENKAVKDAWHEQRAA